MNTRYSLLNNRTITIAMVLLVLLVLFGHCANSGQSEAIERRISSAEAKKIMDDSANVIILDVRTEEEYRAKHIENAVLLPVGEIKERAHIVIPDKNALILVHCLRGGRSKVATGTLISMGYTNVYDFGGIETWGYGTVSVD